MSSPHVVTKLYSSHDDIKVNKWLASSFFLSVEQSAIVCGVTLEKSLVATFEQILDLIFLQIVTRSPPVSGDSIIV